VTDINDVNAGSKGQSAATRHAIVILDGPHLHCVAYDKPGKTQAFPKKAFNDFRRHGSGEFYAFNLRKKNVSSHDRGDSGLDGRTEGDEFTRFQFVQAPVNKRKIQVRIHGRIPVAGEMLAAAHQPFFGEGLDRGNGEGSGVRGVRRKTAVPYHRIVFIAVDIQHRRQIEIDSYTPEFRGGDAGG